MARWLARLGGMHRWTIGHPAARGVLFIVMLAPLLVAGNVAVTTHLGAATIPGLVCGVVGGLFSGWWIHRGGWDLDRVERMAVWDATRSGRSTGLARLDAIAAYQLEGACRSYPADRWFVVVMSGLATLAPVVAAIRTGQLWWLFCLSSSALLILALLSTLSSDPPRGRLDRLTATPTLMTDTEPL